MPNTPSVITRIPPPVSPTMRVARWSCFSRLSISLCVYTKRLPWCRRTPSMMQACDSASYTITSWRAPPPGRGGAPPPRPRRGAAAAEVAGRGPGVHHNHAGAAYHGVDDGHRALVAEVEQHAVGLAHELG